MRRDIYTLRATGMTLADVGEWDSPMFASIDSRRKAERYVDASKVKGFPIVVDDETRTLVGYLGSHELRTAIGESRYNFPLYDKHSLIVWPQIKLSNSWTYSQIPSAPLARILPSSQTQGGLRSVTTRTWSQTCVMPLPSPAS